MADFLDILRRTNCGALIALGAIFATLLRFHGAHDATSAALFACAMSILIIALAVFAGGGDVTRALSRSAIPAMAAALFVVLALITTIPGLPALLGPALGHPPTDAAAALSVSPHRTFEGVAAFLAPALAFMGGALTTPSRETRDWAGRWLIALSIPYMLAGVAMYFSYETDVQARYDIGLPSADAAAAVLGIVILIAGALIMRAGAGRFDGGEAAASLPKIFRWARYLVGAPISLTAFVLSFACMLLTASQGGTVALGIAIVVFGVCVAIGEARSSRRQRGSLIIPSLAVAGIAALLFYRGGDFIRQRFAASAESSADRNSFLAAHWQAFLDSRLFGNGLNTFQEIRPVSDAVEGSTATVHNLFVQVLSETGIIGAVLFALMLGPQIIRALTRIARGASGVEWSACAVAITVFCLAHGTVGLGLQIPAVAALFAFMFGALVGESERVHEPAPARNPHRFTLSTMPAGNIPPLKTLPPKKEEPLSGDSPASPSGTVPETGGPTEPSGQQST